MTSSLHPLNLQAFLNVRQLSLVVHCSIRQQRICLTLWSIRLRCQDFLRDLELIVGTGTPSPMVSLFTSFNLQLEASMSPWISKRIHGVRWSWEKMTLVGSSNLGVAICTTIESLTLGPWWFVFIHQWGAHCDQKPYNLNSTGKPFSLFLSFFYLHFVEVCIVNSELMRVDICLFSTLFFFHILFSLKLARQSRNCYCNLCLSLQHGDHVHLHHIHRHCPFM
jgi:hypothetical protein